MLAIVRRVPVAEALPVLGLLAIAIAAMGPQPAVLGSIWLALVTPRLVAVDLAEHRLPDAIVLPGYPVVLAAVLLRSWADGVEPLDVVLAGAGCGLVFLLLHAAGGMGFGDVKLAPLLGSTAATAVPGGGLLWVVLAFLIGGACAAVVLVRHGAGARMPFGPPMLAGAWAVVVLHAVPHAT